MKKNLLLFTFLVLGFIVKSQDIDKAVALNMVAKNATLAGLTSDDLNNVIVSNSYTDRSAGLDMIYLQQSYKGLPVFNELQVLAFRNGSLVSNSGGRIHDIAAVIKDLVPTVSAESAVRTALTEKKLSVQGGLNASTLIPGKKFDFGKLGIAHVNVTAELMWVPLNDAKEVRLSWQVYLVPVKTSDYWMIRVDAVKNRVIAENNLTVYCDWKDPAKAGMPLDHFNHDHADKSNTSELKLTNFLDFSNIKDAQQAAASPSIVNSANYRVIKFPAESPKHVGGNPVLVTDPWNAAPGNATSLKWHSNGTTDYAITRGNNVWAKEDHAANNGNGGQPATSTTSPDPLNFNFIPDFSKQPNQTAPVPNQQFNITNLFYWINTFHDIMYQYGFDEPGGNFQANNQGRGGVANDFVFGDAQDGNYIAPNQDNANFSTPADGGNGRMQMYLWDTAATLKVNTPASIAFYYSARESGFSTSNKLINIGPVTGQVIYYNDDAAGTAHDACTAAANSLTGKIALINRGNCNFTIKVKNAQNAGAIGVIMVNNVPGALVTMAGDDNTITIPAVFVSQGDGLLFSGQLGNNLNVTLSAANIDGDVDNGVIVHEHGHGLSNRLTGGPSQASCLANAEQMGEGWSDYYCLMLTQDWATSNLQTGLEVPRTIGTYAIGQSPGGAGIRTQPYCTDFGINNLVFSAALPGTGLQHSRGEIWCATLWDMTWDIINQTGTINNNIYDATSNAGNIIALKLVTEGMKLQPCSPGFITARDAILKADTLLYGAAYSCTIKEAFRRRGMGPNASQGSSNSVTDQVADFQPFNCANCSAVTTVTQPANTVACTGTDATFSVTVTGTTPAYQWQVSTNGGTSFTNIAGATNATLTVTAVTAALNNNQYQVVISNTCPSTVTTTPAILTVNNPASISAQPAGVTACSGSNANFSVTAAGTNLTYQWQVSTNGGSTFTNIAGATASTLALTGVTGSMNGNQYQVVIASCGPTGLVSSAVTLTVNSAATIATQPANTSACTGGGDATFTVTATGDNLGYQWQVSTNGGSTFTNITGATAATLTITGVTSALNNNVYQAIISNPCTVSLATSQATLTVSDPASITTQPAAATICAGNNTSFTVATAGSSVTYQWQVSTDGGTTFTDIAGATAATLTLNNVTGSMNNNQYHVLVFSCSPTGLSSANVTLTVNSPVAVTTAPVNTSACVGSNASFSVSANGTGNTYQWQVSTNGGTSFVDINGETAATLNLPAVTTGMNNNVYQVVIGNSCTAAPVSANAILTVSNTASITAQPANAVACAGTNSSFTASASGSSYQWQVSSNGGTSFTDITGQTSTTLNLSNVTASMNNNVYQLVIGSCGSSNLTSNQVTLTVNDPATISLQPTNTAVCDGANASFSVTAAGTANAYQWSVSTDGGTTFTDITGATNASLNVPAVTAALNNNLYQVIISNSCTASLNSSSALLTVNPASTITSQPADVSVCEGSTATFTVAATNVSGTGYQWQVSINGGTSFTDINGATAATLTVSGITASMNNNVYHAVINGCGNISSANAVLTVNASPVVVITAAPYVNLTTGLSTTLTASSTPAAATYSWFKNNVAIASATSNTITVNYSELGAYSASVTDANGCSNTSNTITIADSVVNIAFIYPNPNNGFFQVRFQGVELNNKARMITMFDAKGARVLSQSYVVFTSYEVMDVHAEKLSKGVYALVLTDAAGNTLGTGKVLIQ